MMDACENSKELPVSKYLCPAKDSFLYGGLGNTLGLVRICLVKGG
jgi:hypothetical protein